MTQELYTLMRIALAIGVLGGVIVTVVLWAACALAGEVDERMNGDE